jgi:hypothetical protein
MTEHALLRTPEIDRLAVEGRPDFPDGGRLDFEQALHHMLAYGDFLANRTTRWFLKIDDDAVVSPSGLKFQIEYLESKYNPLTQVAGGAQCLQFHLIQIRGGSGYIASRRLIEELRAGAEAHLHSVQGDDRAVGSLFQTFWNRGWASFDWSSPHLVGQEAELGGNGPTLPLYEHNFDTLLPCPHPSAIRDSSCANHGGRCGSWRCFTH